MIAAFLFASLLAAGQHIPPPAVGVPPPAADVPMPPMPIDRQRFVSFSPGAIDCGGVAVVPDRREEPYPSVGFAYSNDQPLPATGFYRLRFSIDGSGRPEDIAVDKDDLPHWIDRSDIMPAFAAWHFAAGAPRQGCVIAFAIHDYPISAAPPAEAMRYFAMKGGDRDLFERTIPKGSTCFQPNAPAELVRVWPDFETIPQPPGTRSFTMIGYDINRHGKPIHVHVVASDGNRVLDAKGVAAMKRSRYVNGARSGCTYPFRRTPIAPLKAPPSPDVAAFRPPDADCDGVGAWTNLALTTFPEAFRKRSIEGWAIVQYDVAPWGETGDFKVLKAEPAEAFGTQAIETIRRSTKPSSKRGYTGCVDKVAFKMTKPGSNETID